MPTDGESVGSGVSDTQAAHKKTPGVWPDRRGFPRVIELNCKACRSGEQDSGCCPGHCQFPVRD
jgi:hypothetical protein